MCIFDWLLGSCCLRAFRPTFLLSSQPRLLFSTALSANIVYFIVPALRELIYACLSRVCGGRSTGAEGGRRERGAGIVWLRISLPLRHARALLLWSSSDQLGVGLDASYQSTCSLTSANFVECSSEMHTAESLDPPAIESLGQSRSATPSHHGPLQIGFLGLGTMGYYMARNLATHPQSRPPGSLPLVVFNRTADKARSFQSALGTENVRIADSVGQLAVECDVIITNLATDEVVLQIYREFAVALSVTRYVWLDSCPRLLTFLCRQLRTPMQRIRSS